MYYIVDMEANADPFLNHELAQQICREEEIRVAQGDLTALAASQEDESDLQGEPLTYKQCRQLCGNHFVRHTLFRVSGNAKATAPLKMTDLQHTTLARHMLSRFIQVYRSPPNNNQVAIYFVQQCYCYYVLRHKVDWNDRPFTAGVGKGRPAEKVHAQETNEELPRRKRGYTYLPEETAVLEQLATQGVDLASQGETPAMLRARNRELERRVAWYEARYGPIPEEDMDDATASESLGTEEFRISDLLGASAQDLNTI